MSYRVVNNAAMTNHPAVIAALQEKKWSYIEQQGSIQITSGPMNKATINLTTGDVVGDSDDHGMESTGKIQSLNQQYARELVRLTLQNEGGYIESETVDGEDIVLIVQTA